MKETALVWHYREADAWLGEFHAQQLTEALMSICMKQNLQIMQGNKVVEIKSNEYTKGSEVARLLRTGNYDFILAMGDDTTDEDMFRALPPSAVTIKVGCVSENARYNLTKQTDVIPFLRQLADQHDTQGTKNLLDSAVGHIRKWITNR